MEPVVGLEPTTDGLQNRCSTTELNWRPKRGNPQTSKKTKPFGNALRIADKAKKASAGNAKRHGERQSPVERSADGSRRIMSEEKLAPIHVGGYVVNGSAREDGIGLVDAWPERLLGYSVSA